MSWTEIETIAAPNLFPLLVHSRRLIGRTATTCVGIDLDKAWPTDLQARTPNFDDYDLVVCLTKAAFENLPRLPFHTTALQWDIDTSTSPELVYRQLTPHVRELMDRLRGEQAG